MSNYRFWQHSSHYKLTKRLTTNKLVQNTSKKPFIIKKENIHITKCNYSTIKKTTQFILKVFMLQLSSYCILKHNCYKNTKNEFKSENRSLHVVNKYYYKIKQNCREYLRLRILYIKTWNTTDHLLFFSTKSYSSFSHLRFIFSKLG